jgi:hypothetical protein
MTGTGKRKREPPGETPGIFIVLSGFATTDVSVRFRDACQGAEPMEKRQRRGLIVAKFSWHLPGNFRPAVSTARRSRTTERSESVSEEAEYILYRIFC